MTGEQPTMADVLEAATAAVDQHLTLYMLPANYSLDREYNQLVADANSGTIAAKVIAALSAAGFGPVREACEVAWAKGATSAGMNLMALQAAGINPNPYREASNDHQ